jgi:hypothetical protein
MSGRSVGYSRPISFGRCNEDAAAALSSWPSKQPPHQAVDQAAMVSGGLVERKTAWQFEAYWAEITS